MKCPFCSSTTNKVVDKRAVTGTGDIRRRRECLKCGKRFTTYEKLAEIELWVIKRDGRRELFNLNKIKVGLSKALEKRPAFNKLDDLALRVESQLRKKAEREISSKLIGKLVLLELKKLDSVAYLRFVSVYRQFKQLEDFAKELEHLS